MFHVKHAPVKELTAALRPALHEFVDRGIDNLHRERSDQVSGLAPGLAVNVDVSPSFPVYLDTEPDIPVLIGDNQLAVALAEGLFEEGILATAVRPPTVPKGTARLRLSVTLAHEKEHLDKAAKVIASKAKELGVL